LKDNIGLVEHAKKCLNEGYGYVWGTFCNRLTEQLLKDKIKQYPNGVGDKESIIRSKWMGKMVTDCVGLIKGYMWWDGTKAVYDQSTDVSANGMHEAAKEKGSIKTIPEIPGLCVWKSGHIGVYIGNGKVIESRGTAIGVIQSNLRDYPWIEWLKCPFISYEPEPPKPHWGEEPYTFLRNSGIVIHEKRFEDSIKRAENFAIMAQQQAMINDLKGQINMLKERMNSI
jgi:hypothetical protein